MAGYVPNCQNAVASFDQGPQGATNLMDELGIRVRSPEAQAMVFMATRQSDITATNYGL